MRLQLPKWTRHAGVLLVTSFVVLTAAAAGGESRLPRELPPPARDGAALFRTYCASCHGVNATGSGPAAIAMRVAPPNLTRIAKRNNGVFPSERVRQIIEGRGPAAHGERAMPVWGDVFARRIADEDPKVLIDRLVKYLDGLQERTGE
jgi:hypothetical protein